jgi:hypothetical protein
MSWFRHKPPKNPPYRPAQPIPQNPEPNNKEQQ